MKLFMYIDRINHLHQLIKRKSTGTPEMLAKKLNLSVSRVHQIIEELKIMQVPIAYSRTMKSYYYTNAYEVLIDVQLKPLNDHEYQQVGGFRNQITSFRHFFKNFLSL
ncbi:DUF2013 domain-containing protein [Olivibacter sp. SDN3]|uniref:DUF2013 domain-containing protein n=1 Tax=Olivibacter sp. SDN3 TaxID=2764720 RepID=UPI001650F51C|nr:DUF2013 domain-containing protein [Olivibacter sp. SDN3]QNL51727.1 DUF2013 domain-containing protein [Olivibacter sp. SDN3]